MPPVSAVADVVDPRRQGQPAVTRQRGVVEAQHRCADGLCRHEQREGLHPGDPDRLSADRLEVTGGDQVRALRLQPDGGRAAGRRAQRVGGVDRQKGERAGRHRDRAVGPFRPVHRPLHRAADTGELLPVDLPTAGELAVEQRARHDEGPVARRGPDAAGEHLGGEGPAAGLVQGGAARGGRPAVDAPGDHQRRLGDLNVVAELPLAVGTQHELADVGGRQLRAGQPESGRGEETGRFAGWHREDRVDVLEGRLRSLVVRGPTDCGDAEVQRGRNLLGPQRLDVTGHRGGRVGLVEGGEHERGPVPTESGRTVGRRGGRVHRFAATAGQHEQRHRGGGERHRGHRRGEGTRAPDGSSAQHLVLHPPPVHGNRARCSRVCERLSGHDGGGAASCCPACRRCTERCHPAWIAVTDRCHRAERPRRPEPTGKRHRSCGRGGSGAPPPCGG